MFKLGLYFFLAITLVLASQEAAENNEACAGGTSHNYYYIYAQNSVSCSSSKTQGGGPSQNGRNQHTVQGIVCDNSVVSSLNDEVAELKTRLAAVEEDYVKVVEEVREIQRQLNKSNGQQTTINNNTMNCSDIARSGVYNTEANTQLNAVYCEVDENGTSWLVFQRRIDESVYFDRVWQSYQQGFGNLEGNFWLGLDALHEITNSGSFQLRVDMEDWENNTAYALYNSFSVGDESSNYQLSVAGYDPNSTAGDSFSDLSGQEFSTKYRDNDNYVGDCANTRFAGWWFNQCGASSLNGPYLRTQQDTWRSIYWWFWKNRIYVLKRVQMKIKLA